MVSVKRYRTPVDTEHRNVRRQTGLQCAGDVGHSQRLGRRDGHLLDRVLQRHAELHEAGHDVRQRVRRPGDVELLEVGADDVREEALRPGALGHAPGEIEAAEADVEQHAAVLGLLHHRQNLAVLVEDAALVAVIDVGDDVACLRDAVDFVGRLIARLKLMLADMGVKRQVEDLRETLADLGRPIAIAAERADLDVAKQARMRLLEIEPIGDRDVGQRADVGFDEVQSEDAERPDVRTGIKRRLGLAFEQRQELVECADAGTAGLDIGRHALADADAVGIGKAQRSIDVNVNVDPARREIGARQIDGLDIGRKTGDRPDLAVLESDILDAVDALARVDDMGALEQDGTG